MRRLLIADYGVALGSAPEVLHARHPGQPISVSVHGAGGSPPRHSDDSRGGSFELAVHGTVEFTALVI